MKKLLIIALLALLSCTAIRAQEYRVYNGSSQVDSTLLGRSALSILGPGVTVNQSRAMRTAFDSYVASNASKKLTGYRIRVEKSKLTTVRALQGIGFETIAAGASFNDLGMIQASKAGILFRSTEQIRKDHPELPACETYYDLLALIRKAY